MWGAGIVREVCGALRDLVLPPHCCGCGAPVAEGWWCSRCSAGLPRIRAPFCSRCSQPFDGAIEGPFVCPNCHDIAFSFRFAVCAVRSRGSVRELIHALKYGGAAWAARPLGELAASALEDPRFEAPADLVVPVPLHALRRRERGYNQSELLAREVARAAATPLCAALGRTRPTPTQTAFDRRRRMRNLRNAFHMRHDVDVTGLRILLIDDVLTTGSTLHACAAALRRAGARDVVALAAARG